MAVVYLSAVAYFSVVSGTCPFGDLNPTPATNANTNGKIDRVKCATNQNYESLPALNKSDFVWTQLTHDETGGEFMNPIETLLYASQSSYLELMQSLTSDWRDKDHRKITHGVGGHARAHFEWLSNPYTGMFQQADHCTFGWRMQQFPELWNRQSVA
eukprot:m.268466 g.268466  ORF g.268466 m.268466 type:complete len:157 (+) comp78582_c0_seq1:135-605(+)